MYYPLNSNSNVIQEQNALYKFLDHTDLDPTARLAWLCIFGIWNEAGHNKNPIQISTPQLMSKMGYDDKKAPLSAVKKLAEHGYIELKHNGKFATSYTLFSPLHIMYGDNMRRTLCYEKGNARDSKEDSCGTENTSNVPKIDTKNGTNPKGKEKEKEKDPHSNMYESKEGDCKGGENISVYEDLPGAVNEALAAWRQYMHSLNRRFNEQALHDEAIRYVMEIGATNYITALKKAMAAGLSLPVISQDMRQGAKPTTDTWKPKEPPKEYRAVSYAEAERLAEEREQQQQRQDEIQQEENPNLKRFNEAMAAHFGGGKSGDIWR